MINPKSVAIPWRGARRERSGAAFPLAVVGEMSNRSRATTRGHEKSVWAKVGPFGNLRVTPLMKACAAGDVDEALKELEAIDPTELASELSAGDDWAGSSPLHWASYAGNPHIVAALLEKRADASLVNRCAPRRAGRHAREARWL